MYDSREDLELATQHRHHSVSSISTPGSNPDVGSMGAGTPYQTPPYQVPRLPIFGVGGPQGPQNGMRQQQVSDPFAWNGQAPQISLADVQRLSEQPMQPTGISSYLDPAMYAPSLPTSGHVSSQFINGASIADPRLPDWVPSPADPLTDLDLAHLQAARRDAQQNSFSHMDFSNTQFPTPVSYPPQNQDVQFASPPFMDHQDPTNHLFPGDLNNMTTTPLQATTPMPPPPSTRQTLPLRPLASPPQQIPTPPVPTPIQDDPMPDVTQSCCSSKKAQQPLPASERWHFFDGYRYPNPPPMLQFPCSSCASTLCTCTQCPETMQSAELNGAWSRACGRSGHVDDTPPAPERREGSRQPQQQFGFQMPVATTQVQPQPQVRKSCCSSKNTVNPDPDPVPVPAFPTQTQTQMQMQEAWMQRQQQQQQQFAQGRQMLHSPPQQQQQQQHHLQAQPQQHLQNQHPMHVQAQQQSDPNDLHHNHNPFVNMSMLMHNTHMASQWRDGLP